MWETLPLGQATDIVNGGTPKSKTVEYWGGGVQWITPKDMGALSDYIVSTTSRTISEAGLNKSSAKLVPENSVILSTRAPIGHLAINAVPMAFNQGCRGLVPNDQLTTMFLFYFLMANIRLLDSLGTGATFKELSKGVLAAVRIPIPPLPEQKQIVTILDEAFAGIDAAIANTQKNRTNARELFESYLNNIFTQKGDGWVEKTLGEACIVERGSSPRPIKQYLTDAVDGVNWIKIGDTKGVKKTIRKTKQKITPEGARKSRRVKPGDFILTNSMSYGKPFVMETTGYIHDGWFVLRLNEEVNTDFFYYLLSSAVVQKQFSNLAAGAVVKNISGDLVKQALLSMAPIQEQEILVKNIEALACETQRLEAIYQQKLEALAELKQSILQKAFSGELTSNTDEIKTEALTANIIAFAYFRHASKQRDKTFGRVKAQKTLHLAEAIGGIELGRKPIKDAAGPNDFSQQLKAEKWAKTEQFFEFVKKPSGNGYNFKKLKRFNEMLAIARTETKPYHKILDKILDIVLPMDTQKAEVFVTVHAAWNNLILDGGDINDEAIILAARDHWHLDKLKIPKAKFQKAIRFIRQQGLIPDGKAKRVLGQENLF